MKMRLIMSVIIILALVAVFAWGITADVVLQETLVTKIIDGDTFIIEGGEHVRMLGMDTDEKGYPCWAAAKDELERLVLNKRVLLETDSEDKDQYGRLLRWVWLNETLVNFELVRSGLAVARFDSDAKYKEEITSAEHEAITNRIGCKWSSLK